MKNYTDESNKVYSYDDDISKEILDAKIKELGLVAISDIDLAILRLPTVTDKKTIKTQEINTACATQIISGFTSNAVDVAIDRHYQSEETDQLNLIGVIAGGIDDLFKAGVEDVDFATNGIIAWSYEPHTIAQLVQVLNDGKAYKQTLLQKAYTLKAQVDVATTVAQVDAIVW